MALANNWRRVALALHVPLAGPLEIVTFPALVFALRGSCVCQLADESVPLLFTWLLGA